MRRPRTSSITASSTGLEAWSCASIANRGSSRRRARLAYVVSSGRLAVMDSPCRGDGFLFGQAGERAGNVGEQPRDDLVGGDGAGEEVALGDAAARPEQGVALRGGLHAL